MIIFQLLWSYQFISFFYEIQPFLVQYSVLSLNIPCYAEFVTWLIFWRRLVQHCSATAMSQRNFTEIIFKQYISGPMNIGLVCQYHYVPAKSHKLLSWSIIEHIWNIIFFWIVIIPFKFENGVDLCLYILPFDSKCHFR